VSTVSNSAQVLRHAQKLQSAAVNTLRVCSAKALSKYTEMVDNLIRQQKDKLEAASDEARLRLREWDMPEALQASHTPIHYLTLHRAPSFTIA